jgi:hypothetical protein
MSINSLISSSLPIEVFMLKQMFQKPINFKNWIAVLTAQAADTRVRKKMQLKWNKMHPTAGGLKNAERLEIGPKFVSSVGARIYSYELPYPCPHIAGWTALELA